jgi:hypothetical protein
LTGAMTGLPRTKTTASHICQIRHLRAKMSMISLQIQRR